MAASAEQDAWIARVLGVGSLRAQAEVRSGTVAFRKLLLRWREAQSQVQGELQALGATLLAHPKVKVDPRRPAVERAVRELPALIPRFSGALEDALDAGISEADPAKLPQHAAAGATAIDAYLSALAGARQLSALEGFAAKYLGRHDRLATGLIEALQEVRRGLPA